MKEKKGELFKKDKFYYQPEIEYESKNGDENITVNMLSDGLLSGLFGGATAGLDFLLPYI